MPHSIWKRVYAIIAPYRVRLTVSMVTLIILTGLGLWSPYWSATLIGEALPNKSAQQFFQCVAMLFAISLASAQSDEVDLAWVTIDGGGAVSTDGTQYSLSGTIGQPDAGSMLSGAYTLTGGFWGGATGSGAPASLVYLPLIRK